MVKRQQKNRVACARGGAPAGGLRRSQAGDRAWSARSAMSFTVSVAMLLSLLSLVGQPATAAARDADAIRAALGYEKFNFYGVSYGTELGQFLMRERPQHLRAVILDAVVPLGFSLVTDVPVVKQRVMQQFSSACRELQACNLAYPGLGDRYPCLSRQS